MDQSHPHTQSFISSLFFRTLSVVEGFLFLTLILFLFTGCPYRANAPLGKESNKKADSKFIGKWERAGETGKIFIDIKESEKKNTLHVSFENEDLGKMYFKAWPAKFNQDLIYNVEEFDSAFSNSRNLFYFYKVRMQKERLITNYIYEPADPPFKEFKTTEDRDKEFVANWNKPKFWFGELEWDKVN